jgi:hypothetical protein
MRHQTKLVLSGMLAVGAAFFVVIKGGFLIHDRYPDIPDPVFAPISRLPSCSVSHSEFCGC